jgi:hypothetical protein
LLKSGRRSGCQLPIFGSSAADMPQTVKVAKTTPREENLIMKSIEDLPAPSDEFESPASDFT